jgi:transposase
MKAGDRVKTDRRDAVMLAKLHRAGELSAVWVPDDAHEAMRDLVRARATAARVLAKARQHLQGFLLRHGLFCDSFAVELGDASFRSPGILRVNYLGEK